MTKSKKNWGYPNWKKNCPDFTFKTLKKEGFPPFLPANLSDKYNSGYLASSGTTGMYNGEETDFYIGFFVGLRIDKDNIDEQPYVSVYKQKTGEHVFDGYLQHGSYDNRTTKLSNEQMSLINSSGISVDIQTNRLPNIEQGQLNYLAENKIIT